MTTVVSRLYETAETAERIAADLRADGFPDSTLSVITEAEAGAIRDARVSDRAAERYAEAMIGGRALLVCRAPFTPFGAARRAMEAADSAPWVDVGMGALNEHISEVADLDGQTPSVLGNHPMMLTRDDYVGSGWAEWRLSHVFGFPTVSPRRKRSLSVISGGRYMSRSFWPGKLLSAKQRKSHVFRGGRLFLTSKRSVSSPHKRSVMTRHPKFSEKLGFRTLSDHH